MRCCLLLLLLGLPHWQTRSMAGLLWQCSCCRCYVAGIAGIAGRCQARAGGLLLRLLALPGARTQLLKAELLACWAGKNVRVTCSALLQGIILAS